MNIKIYYIYKTNKIYFIFTYMKEIVIKNKYINIIFFILRISIFYKLVNNFRLDLYNIIEYISDNYN